MRFIQTGIVVLGGALAVATVVKSQAPAAPQAATTWEYARVTAGLPLSSHQVAGQWIVSGSAEICYGTSGGCRAEEITSTAASDGVNLADPMMKAAADLGAQGWELTSVMEPATGGSRTFYFRRAKGRVP